MALQQDQRRAYRWGGALIAAAMVLAACAGNFTLSAPPNLYLEGRNYPDSLVPENLRVIDPPIFFVTDRSVEDKRDGGIAYGTARSNSMAFGQASVRFGAADWDDLIERTHVDRAGNISRLEVDSITERVRFSSTPLETERYMGALRNTPDADLAYSGRAQDFQDAVRAEIQRTGNGRVLIFAHGVFTDFEFGLQTLASLWHFAGRRSTPVLFSWPAGNRGVLGYFRDQAAGDFSVYHAKEMLRLLAEIPEVTEIDIVAHSRGTSVMTQALRELVIYNRGRGKHPKLAMKTGTLILAAPDLDAGVFRQRLLAERGSEAYEQVNIYVNPRDFALGLTTFIANHPRVGRAPEKEFSSEELAEIQKAGLIHFIQVEDSTGADSHSYFRNNPAVLSDVVLALRTRAFPGGTLRPLEVGEDGLWVLQPNYPLERLPELEEPNDNR